MSTQELNIRPDFDREIVDIVDYVMNYEITSRWLYDTAHYCLLDTLGCGLERWNTRPVKIAWANRARHGGAQRRTRAGHPVPARSGTGSFNIGAMIRWLDFNDAWLAAEWDHPSDNLGGIPRRLTGCHATPSPPASAADHETGIEQDDQSP